MFENVLFNLQKDFFARKSIEKIHWKDILNNISWDNQNLLADSTILHPLIIKYPLKSSYQSCFLKYIINCLEKQQIEIHDKFFEAYCEQKQQTDNENFAYKHYILDKSLKNIITLKESSSLIAEGTTGLYCWQAGIALADWAMNEHNTNLFKNNKILELGSGTGLTGILICKICQPEQFIFSDCHPAVLKLLNENLELNFGKDLKNSTSPKPSIEVLFLDWNLIETTHLETIIIPDIIIASDVIYDDTIFKPFLNTIKYIFKLNNNCRLILSSTIRNKETFQKFLQLIDDENLEVTNESIVKSNNFDWDDTQAIKIMSVTSR